MSRWMLVPSLLLLAQTAGQPELRYFRYQRPVTVDDVTRAQACVALDALVLSHASADLSDLRMYDGTREVPYALDLGTRPVAGRSSPTLLNRGVRDGHVVFDVYLQRPSYRSLELQVNTKDFVASVEVSGSTTADAMRPTRLGTFTIFDLTSQQLTRSTVLNLPASNFPYLHFTITGPLQPEQITGVSVLDPQQRPPVYRTIQETSTIVRRGTQSVATFDVPARVPVEHVEIVPAPGDANFNRSVLVEATRPSASSPARFVGNVFRVHTVHEGVRIDQERYSFDFAGGAYDAPTHWSVIVDNGDDTPIALQSVRVGMRERRLCFKPAAGAAYTLVYGDSVLRAPRYDYATLVRLDDQASPATLGTEQVNPQYEARPDTRPFTERYPAVLWTVLVAVIVGLGAIALKTAARMKLVDGQSTTAKQQQSDGGTDA